MSFRKEVAAWSSQVFKFNSLHQNQNSQSEGLDLYQKYEAIRSLAGERYVVEVFPCTFIAIYRERLSASTWCEWKIHGWDVNRSRGDWVQFGSLGLVFNETRVREQLFKIGIVSAPKKVIFDEDGVRALAQWVVTDKIAVVTGGFGHSNWKGLSAVADRAGASVGMPPVPTSKVSRPANHASYRWV